MLRSPPPFTAGRLVEPGSQTPLATQGLVARRIPGLDAPPSAS